ncbi:sulfatase family protein [Snuella sedimenti]|uniref:Sulfatase n=1 Tax=Snuella sedimenti TaxID=2798802 RepID=A0A8J7IEV9_9FLAO|nr:sulfatase [Snuella sedimenti]MBJ6367007.1 sulfatase [Snuella sedimenti]
MVTKRLSIYITLIVSVSLILVVSSFNSCKNSDVPTEKPNILWLVVEDMSPFLASYGNKYTTTPTLNALADNGVVFTNAFSNGAQCSPARSTLMSGIYAPMLATDWHREARAVPQDFYYTKYLQEAGYYCTNNSKTDYNAKNVPKKLWNESNQKASYLNRPNKTQPFFSVFNYNGTHTKRVATRNTKGRTPRTIALDSVAVPPYLPNVEEIKNDIAWYYDAVNKMDIWVKKRLDELEASGEADNTIVFFYSDHGGCLPRGKAYVYDTGTRVPLIVHLPEKYKHLAQTTSENKNDNLVGFIDFAPTVLNLIGIETPDFMMGQPFLGKQVPEPKSELFLYRANQEQSYIPSRALTDGRYKLIWNFNTAYPNGTRQSYQWQMPSYQGWDKAHIEGKTDSLQSVFWKPTTAIEFYDTQTDSFEVNNLANDPKYQAKVSQMKQDLIAFMKQKKDLGLYPWSMRKQKDTLPFYSYVKQTNQPVEAIIDAAAFASTAKVSDIETIKGFLNSDEPAIRFWGSVGVLQLLERQLINDVPDEVNKNFNNDNENTEIRLLSAEILVKSEANKNALNYILDQVKNDYFIAYATLQNLGALAKPIEEELIKLRGNKKLNQFYIKSALINTGQLAYQDLWNDTDKSEKGYNHHE